MNFNVNNGSSAFITIILMLIVISIAAFGFIILVSSMNENAAIVNNDTTNLSGISYNTEIYNATNSTMHGLAAVMPNFIWVIIIFLIIVFLTLLAIGLKRR